VDTDKKKYIKKYLILECSDNASTKGYRAENIGRANHDEDPEKTILKSYASGYVYPLAIDPSGLFASLFKFFFG
jgi:hypothetical protein